MNNSWIQVQIVFRRWKDGIHFANGNPDLSILIKCLFVNCYQGCLIHYSLSKKDETNFEVQMTVLLNFFPCSSLPSFALSFNSSNKDLVRSEWRCVLTYFSYSIWFKCKWKPSWFVWIMAKFFFSINLNYELKLFEIRVFWEDTFWWGKKKRRKNTTR